MNNENQKNQTLSGEVTQSDGQISTPPYSRPELDEKFSQMTFVLLGVVVILIVMVATLIIDSFHINSVTYKEYSEKIEILNSLRDNNNELLLQNKQNQELILKQQEQVMNLFNKRAESLQDKK